MENQETRTCSVCKEKKELNKENFRWRNSTNDFHKQCKYCMKEYEKKRWKKKLENETPEQKAKRKENQVKKTKKMRSKPGYTARYNEKRNALHRERMANDPEYREKRKLESAKKRLNPQVKIKDNISRGVRYALKKNGLVKRNKTEELLGYPIKTLIEHLKATLQEDIKWEEYCNDKDGNFNIDHIIPQSEYDLTNDNEFKKCWHYKNLRITREIPNKKKHKSLNLSLVEENKLFDLMPRIEP